MANFLADLQPNTADIYHVAHSTTSIYYNFQYFLFGADLAASFFVYYVSLRLKQTCWKSVDVSIICFYLKVETEEMV